MKALYIEPRKIILFSSDIPLANNITTSLAEAGYQVVRRFEGIGAVDAIQLEKPLLVILDIELLGMNSLAIIRSIRSAHNNDWIPIILTGSNLREEDILIGLEVGADLCLVENFHPQVFVARVHSLIRRKETMKAPFNSPVPD